MTNYLDTHEKLLKADGKRVSCKNEEEESKKGVIEVDINKNINFRCNPSLYRLSTPQKRFEQRERNSFVKIQLIEEEEHKTTTLKAQLIDLEQIDGVHIYLKGKNIVIDKENFDRFYSVKYETKATELQEQGAMESDD